MMNDKEKCAVVVGASHGIGQAVAVHLATLNYKLILVSRGLDGLEETQKLIAERDGVSHVLQADISNENDIDTIVSFINDRFGYVHVLWLGASPFSPNTLEEETIEMIRQLADTTYFGSLVLTKKLIPLFKAAGHARILIPNTVWTLRNRIGATAFSAAKYALIGLEQGINNELGKYNIYVTTLHLAQVESPDSPGSEEDFKQGYIIPQLDLLNTISFLLSLETAIVPYIVLENRKRHFRYVDGKWRRSQ